MKESVDAKNQGESLVYQAEKTIKDLGDKADKAQVEKVQQAADKLKEALKGTDTDAIKKATEELQAPLYEMSAAAYQQAQAAGGAAGAQPGADAGAGANASAGAAESGSKEEDVVDAEFTDVKDDKK